MNRTPWAYILVGVASTLAAGPGGLAQEHSTTGGPVVVETIPASTGAVQASSAAPAWRDLRASRLRDAPAGPHWLIRYVGSLAVVGALLIGGFLVVRRFQGGMSLAGAGSGQMQVLSRVPLDQRNSLVLVRLHNEDLLLALGASGANLVGRFPAERPEPTP